MRKDTEQNPNLVTEGTSRNIKDTVTKIYRRYGYDVASDRTIDFFYNSNLLRISTGTISNGREIDVWLQGRAQGEDRVRNEDTVYSAVRLGLKFTLGGKPKSCTFSKGTFEDGDFLPADPPANFNALETTGQKFKTILEEIEQSMEIDVTSVEKVRMLAIEKINRAMNEGKLKTNNDDSVQTDYENDLLASIIVSADSDVKLGQGWLRVGITLPNTDTTLLDEYGQDDINSPVEPELQYLIPPRGAEDQRIRYRLGMIPRGSDSDPEAINLANYGYAKPNEIGVLKNHLRARAVI